MLGPYSFEDIQKEDDDENKNVRGIAVCLVVTGGGEVVDILSCKDVRKEIHHTHKNYLNWARDSFSCFWFIKYPESMVEAEDLVEDLKKKHYPKLIEV